MNYDAVQPSSPFSLLSTSGSLILNPSMLFQDHHDHVHEEDELQHSVNNNNNLNNSSNNRHNGVEKKEGGTSNTNITSLLHQRPNSTYCSDSSRQSRV